MSDVPLKTAGKGGQETAACAAFGDDLVEMVSLIFATVGNASHIQGHGGKPDEAAFGVLLFEMCLNRAVDSSLAYVSNVLHLIHQGHSGALKSSEAVDIDFILQFPSIDDLVRAIIERRVHALSYKSLDDLDKYLIKNFEISLFANGGQRVRVVQLVDVRNLIVHNRGVVNRIYKKRNPASVENIGERIRYTQGKSVDELQFLLTWVMDLDVRLIAKFGLPTRPRVPRSGIQPPS